MGKITVLPETTKDPISLIGRRAGICWGQDISNEANNYRRGLDCIKANHGRTLEFVNIETKIEGYSARVIREWYTHIGGAPTRLQASTRYIHYGEFEYVTPESIIRNSEAECRYQTLMASIKDAYIELENLGIPKEDAANILPLGMTTTIVDKRNLRNLIDMSRQRMCTRAYHEYRTMFCDLMNALKSVSDEWETVINMTFMPKCDTLGHCPEIHSCGRHGHKPS